MAIHKKLRRGFKTLAVKNKGRVALKLAKQLKKSRGAETSGVKSEARKRVFRKIRAKRLLNR